METVANPAQTTGPTGGTDVRVRMTQNHREALVVVQRDWSGWRTAMARVRDLRDIHWSQPNGAPRPLIHASVCCNKLLSGDITHDCHLTPPPHDLVVCVLKGHTAPWVFDELSGRADEAASLHVLSRSFGDSALDGVPTGKPIVGSEVLRVRVSVVLLALLATLGGIGWRRRRKRLKCRAT